MEEAEWDPSKPPCVPSDERPENLFRSRLVAKAVRAAWHLESALPFSPDFKHDWDYQEEEEAKSRKEYAHAIQLLSDSYEFIKPRPADLALLNVSKHETRPCPCGHGRLSRWPWVVNHESMGFCDCYMSEWELLNWRIEWMGAGAPDLPW